MTGSKTVREKKKENIIMENFEMIEDLEEIGTNINDIIKVYPEGCSGKMFADDICDWRK